MSATVELFPCPSGQSPLYLRLCAFGSDAIAVDDVELTEGTNRKLLYTGAVTGLVGWHTAHVRTAAGVYFAAGDVWMKTAGVCRIRDSGAAELILTENDGAGDLRLTEKALEQSPGAEAANVWTNPQRTLTMTGNQILGAVRGDKIVVYRGDDNTISLANLGSLVGVTEIWFTLKADKADADSAAALQVSLTGGLLVAAGVVPVSASYGEIVVVDEDSGSLNIICSADGTIDLEEVVKGFWDLQTADSDGAIRTRRAGRGDVELDVTQRIT